jgi:hypothetical protein
MTEVALVHWQDQRGEQHVFCNFESHYLDQVGLCIGMLLHLSSMIQVRQKNYMLQECELEVFDVKLKLCCRVFDGQAVFNEHILTSFDICIFLMSIENFFSVVFCPLHTLLSKRKLLFIAFITKIIVSIVSRSVSTGTILVFYIWRL